MTKVMFFLSAVFNRVKFQHQSHNFSESEPSANARKWHILPNAHLFVDTMGPFSGVLWLNNEKWFHSAKQRKANFLQLSKLQVAPKCGSLAFQIRSFYIENPISARPPLSDFNLCLQSLLIVSDWSLATLKLTQVCFDHSSFRYSAASICLSKGKARGGWGGAEGRGGGRQRETQRDRQAARGGGLIIMYLAVKSWNYLAQRNCHNFNKYTWGVGVVCLFFLSSLIIIIIIIK